MNRNVTIGIVVVLALGIIGYFYVTMMPKPDVGSLMQNPDESVNGVAVPNEQTTVELAGRWRSDDDAKFVREFRADGSVTDSYEGDDSATVRGSWNFVEDPTSEKADLPVVKDAKILKIQFPEEVLYFALLDVSETSLSMSYLGRGNTLSFTRID